MSNRKYREGRLQAVHCMPAQFDVDPFSGVVAAERPSRLKLWAAAVLVAVLGVVAVLSLTGCGMVGGLDKAYVEADRKTLEAVGPEYVEMSKYAFKKQEDGSFVPWFDAEQAERRERTIQSWQIRTERGMQD